LWGYWLFFHFKKNRSNSSNPIIQKAITLSNRLESKIFMREDPFLKLMIGFSFWIPSLFSIVTIILIAFSFLLSLVVLVVVKLADLPETNGRIDW
jgi:hypothetical protein